MDRRAGMYFATEGSAAGAFPLSTREASYRSADFQGRLMRYANLYLTPAQQQQLASLNLRYLPSDIPAIETSFIEEGARNAALTLIRSFFVLDLAYTSLQHQKNAIAYCEANKSTETSRKLLTAVFHSINGYKCAAVDAYDNNGTLKMGPKLAANFPGVTAAIGDGLGNAVGQNDLLFGRRDMYLFKMMRAVRTGGFSADGTGANDFVKDLSLKSLARVFGGLTTDNVTEADIAKEQAELMKAMGEVNPLAAGWNNDDNRRALAANRSPYVPNALTKVRSGRFSAADWEYDTLLREVVEINRTIYRLLKESGGSSGPATFVTGNEVCSGKDRAWRIPTDGGKYLIMRGEKPVDRSGIAYVDAEPVCLDTPLEGPVGGAQGRTLPVRVTVPAPPGAAKQRAAAQRKKKGGAAKPAKRR